MQGESGAGEVQTGFVPAGSSTEIELRIDEPTAVVIGARPTGDEDLTLHLTGAGTDVESDDGSSYLDVFAFELGTRDPALGTVLRPGDYTIAVGEWSDAASPFELQVLTSTTVLPEGGPASLEFGPGRPGIAIVPLTTGDRAIAATSDLDTTLWAYVPASDEEYWDDDGGGDRNPRVELAGESAQQIVVVATGYDRDEGGTLELRVE